MEKSIEKKKIHVFWHDRKDKCVKAQTWIDNAWGTRVGAVRSVVPAFLDHLIRIFIVSQ